MLKNRQVFPTWANGQLRQQLLAGVCSGLVMASMPGVTMATPMAVGPTDVPVAVGTELPPDEQQAVQTLLQTALQSTQSLLDPADQLYPLIHIAEAYQTLGDNATALRLLAAAVPLADPLADAYGQVAIAQIYINAGQESLAIPLLERALSRSSTDEEYFGLSNIAQTAGTLSDQQQVAKLLMAIVEQVPDVPDYHQLRLLSDVITAVEPWVGDTTGEPMAAAVLRFTLDVADGIAAEREASGEVFFENLLSEVLTKIVATAGTFTEATSDAKDVLSRSGTLTYAGSLSDGTATDPRVEVEAIATIAAAYTALGQSQTGADVLDGIVLSLRNDPQPSVPSLVTVAGIAMEMGREQRAVELLALVLDILEPMVETGNTDTYGRSLELTIAAIAQLSDPQQSIMLLTDAIALTNQIGWPYTKNQTFFTIIGTLGDWQHKQYNLGLLPAIFDGIRSLANDPTVTVTDEESAKLSTLLGAPYTPLNSVSSYYTLLTEIGMLATQLDNPQDSRSVLEQTIQLALETNSYYERTFADIALAAVNLRQQEAEAIVERLLGTAEQTEPNTRATTYRTLAKIYADQGNDTQSYGMLMLALEATKQLTDDWHLYNQLAAISSQATALSVGGEQLLQNVIELVPTMEDASYKVLLFKHLSATLKDWQPTTTQRILESTYLLAEELGDPGDKVSVLVAIASGYSDIMAVQPDAKAQALAYLDQAIALMPEIQDFDEFADRWHTIVSAYNGLDASVEGQKTLAPFSTILLTMGELQDSPREVAAETFGAHLATATAAIALNSSQQAKASLEAMIEISNGWSREWTREYISELSDYTLQQYGDTPEQQLENQFYETKGILLALVPYLMLESVPVLVPEETRFDPALTTVMHDALDATLELAQAIPLSDERLVPLTGVAATALELDNPEQVAAALALAANISDVAYFERSMLLGILSQDDVEITADILTAAITKMDTISDEHKSIALAGIADYINEIIQQ